MALAISLCCLFCSARRWLIDDCDGVLQDLRGAVSVLLLRELDLVKAKLGEQTLAEITAAHTRWIELLDGLQRFMKIRRSKFRLVD